MDGIQSPIPYVRAAAERMAVNAPMQGTQADIVKLAMVEIVKYLKDQGAHDGAHMLLQVHDELVFEIEEGRVAELAPKIKGIMENIVPSEERNGIPFIAEGQGSARTGAKWKNYNYAYCRCWKVSQEKGSRGTQVGSARL